ncbi:mannose-1-phosphate guanylyltransferase/mannose-6-phosphate isomerase [Prochlorococcus marinus]|uniref:mannose-1-phosphate guanylyltransferase n=1 Tax=Prochlorococcus marinus XMU1408 TaxID=2213228 RepID=A0A318QXY3_PROMR|nr:mannose-1-phosphate guanylyltransferase/mannose-6-phosphate isomerase [Prochlorococcus marinus]MBW3042831.1 mannose-1-phosphate guanylyltransferase/mannose-6-phosphate isomerase [Prochlorococcus marinus str. XMU1408]PYE00658.1 mannose-1-phosphate guanylyltransferase/mannose-6-phosphate isomerase [Prochlorococcus marinus XMU1408]
MTDNPIIPVILSGGSGTRLWPLSRESYPKQFLALDSRTNKTLLQKTYERLIGIEGLQKPILICNEDHRFIVAEQFREIKTDPQSIILEPIGRNTAPAIAVAALKAISLGKDPLLLILAADHLIENIIEFKRVIQSAKTYAKQGRLVTFGIVPTCAETGYGYIEAKESTHEKDTINGLDIKNFIEKPNKAKAEELIKDARYTWNSGMFLFKASTIINELEKFAPEIINYCKISIEKNIVDLDFLRLEEESFKKCPKLSIDIAVMEKTKLGTVLPLNVGWSDIGSWKSLWDISQKNNDGNYINGRVVAEKSKNCYLKSEQRLIVGLGIENLIVVDTNDAILVANREHSQNIGNIIKSLDSSNFPEGKMHKKIFRPWGNYTTISEGSRWQVKLIEVKPNASLSLQMHHHRAEHWIIVNGTALIEKDGEKELLSENQSTFIPLGCKHRLSNPGLMKLELIEVQSGTYLDEDDIIRFEDSYGRIKN